VTPHRGEVDDVRFPSGRRPAVVVTSERVIPYLSSVTVAQVTSTVRGLPTEVPLGREHGLDHESVVNCDHLATRLVLTPVGPDEVNDLLLSYSDPVVASWTGPWTRAAVQAWPRTWRPGGRGRQMDGA
jgi:hypothetical protein